MPPGGAVSRASQKEALAGVIFEKRTDPEIGRLLDRLQYNVDTMDPADAATVREAARDYKKASAIPKSMATKMARLESDGYQAWVAARQAGDFSKFAPVLQQWVDLVREKCAILDSERFQIAPLDLVWSSQPQLLRFQYTDPGHFTQTTLWSDPHRH